MKNSSLLSGNKSDRVIVFFAVLIFVTISSSYFVNAGCVGTIDCASETVCPTQYGCIYNGTNPPPSGPPSGPPMEVKGYDIVSNVFDKSSDNNLIGEGEEFKSALPPSGGDTCLGTIDCSTLPWDTCVAAASQGYCSLVYEGIACNNGGGIWCGDPYYYGGGSFCQLTSSPSADCSVEISQTIRVSSISKQNFKFTSLSIKSGRSLQFYIDKSVTNEWSTPMYYKGYGPGNPTYSSGPLSGGYNDLSCYYPVNGHLYYTTNGGVYAQGQDFFMTGACFPNDGSDADSYEYSGGAGGLGGVSPLKEGQPGANGWGCSGATAGVGGAAGAYIQIDASTVSMQSFSSLNVNGLQGAYGGNGGSSCTVGLTKHAPGGAGGGGGGAGGIMIINANTLSMSSSAKIFANGGMGGRGGYGGEVSNLGTDRDGCFGGSGSGGAPGQIKINVATPFTYARSNFLTDPGAGGPAPDQNWCNDFPTPGYTPIIGEITKKNALKICRPEVCNLQDDDCDGLVDEGLNCAGITNTYLDTCQAGASFVTSIANDETCSYGSICAATDSAYCTSLVGGHLCGAASGDPLRTDSVLCLASFKGPTDPNTLKPDSSADIPCSWYTNGLCMCDPDKGVQGVRYYYDNDKDGYGTAASVVTCNPNDVAGYSAVRPGDCVDTNAAINPGMPEICNGIDDNCDGLVDAADPTLGCCSDSDCLGGKICNLVSHICQGQVTCYLDSDVDTYGLTSASQIFINACVSPYVPNGGDCNDANAAIHPEPPAAPELCDGIDNDCNPATLDGSDQCNFALQCCDSVAKMCKNNVTWYRDADGDGFGDNSSSVFSCNQPVGYVADNTDCNDVSGSGSLIYPGAPELCSNGIDNNCNGLIDCADPVCLNVIPENCGDGVDNDCDGSVDSLDSSCCPVFSTSKDYFEIRNRTNNVIARINQDGAMWIKGVKKLPWVNPPAPAASDNNFVVQNSAGSPVMWISGKNGDLYVKGGITQNFVPTPSASGNFVIEDSAGTAKAWVDVAGSIFLKGCFGENRTFS